MPQRKPRPDWDVIRHCYEHTDAAVTAICADTCITRADLETVRKRDGWIRHKPRGFAPGKRPKSTGAADLVKPSTRAAENARATSREAAAKRAKAAASGTVGNRPSRPLDTTKAIASTRSLAAVKRPRAGCKTTLAQRRRLLERLVTAIDMKLEQLEKRMTQDLETPGGNDAASATDHERETRAIGGLIDNLGKITEVETGLDRTNGDTAVAVDLGREAERHRRELAERLRKIVDAGAGKA